MSGQEGQMKAFVGTSTQREAFLHVHVNDRCYILKSVLTFEYNHDPRLPQVPESITVDIGGTLGTASFTRQGAAGRETYMAQITVELNYAYKVLQLWNEGWATA